MSLPDASGQAKTAMLLIASGALSRVVLGATGLIGRRLPRAVAAILDTAAFAAAAVFCAVALFLSGGEVRLTAFLLFFVGLLACGLPMYLYRRKRQEKSAPTPNPSSKVKEG